MNQRDTCYECYRPKSSCMCKHINKIKTNTKFIILMHPKEFRKTKNGTGHFTNKSLPNSELFIGIDFSEHNRINDLINNPKYSSYLLYPGSDSIKLNTQKIRSDKSNIIFIIDSTWPCSKKILRVSKNLQKLPKVSFESDIKSNFQIKTQPDSYCLSTIESTKEVLKLLNNQKIENIKDESLSSFLKPFEKMVEYQIISAKKEYSPRFTP